MSLNIGKRHAMVEHPDAGPNTAILSLLRREEPMGQMKEFAGVFYREGALDPKTMQLVALAAMAAAGCTS